MKKQIGLMVVSILISTIDSGIGKIKEVLLLHRTDVKYIESDQFTNVKFKITPISLKRDDVIVSQIPGKGITKTRNPGCFSGIINLF